MITPNLPANPVRGVQTVRDRESLHLLAHHAAPRASILRDRLERLL
jgi:hypothetical protein